MDTFRKVDTMARMGSSKGSRRVRRQFSEEFRGGAIRLALDEGKTGGGRRSQPRLDALLAGPIHYAVVDVKTDQMTFKQVLKTCLYS